MNFTLGNSICLTIKMTDKWIGDFISTSQAPELGLTKIQTISKNPPEFSALNRHSSWGGCDATSPVRTLEAARTLRPKLFLSQLPGSQQHQGALYMILRLGGSWVISVLNWMAGQYLLWLPQYSLIPTLHPYVPFGKNQVRRAYQGSGQTLCTWEPSWWRDRKDSSTGTCLGHRGVWHWPLEATHRWKPRLGLQRAQPSAPALAYTAPARLPYPILFCSALSIFSSMKGRFCMFWLAVLSHIHISVI